MPVIPSAARNLIGSQHWKRLRFLAVLGMTE